MSLEIIFEKCFTLEDVKNKTNLEIHCINNCYWLVDSQKNKALVSPFTFTQEEINSLIKNGLKLIKEDNNYYEQNGDSRTVYPLDVGFKNIIKGLILSYGSKTIENIVDILVNTFKTNYITINQE